MTKFCFFAGIALAVVACNTAPKTTISVHVDGAQPNAKTSVLTQDSTYSAVLDSTGSAVITLAENLKSGYATLKYGRARIPVYVEPGKSFDLSLKSEGRRMTPVFMGEGAKKNEYLNSNSRFNPDFKGDENAFIQGIKDEEARLYARLDSMGFDAAFNQLEKKRLHYSLYSVLPLYPSYHAYYAQDKEYKPSENYYEVLKVAVPEEPELIGMPEYLEALGAVIDVFAGKDMSEYNMTTYLKNQLAYIQDNIKNPALAEEFTHNVAMRFVSNSGVDQLDVIMPVYTAKVTSSAKKAEFDKLCEKWAAIAKGQPSPTFKYMDINGKEVSLADLAGKYVYVDVWATWCGPCRGELPHLKELEHQFKGKNVHFVSISCDQDKAAWEKMVKEEKLEGIQLHTGGDQNFMNAYMINGIPRFILIDREGKIIAADMSRPSQPETATTLNALEGI